jgi:hypothetical protein
MENLLFTGIHAIFLRIHNQLVRALPFAFPGETFDSDHAYEIAREVNTELFQLIAYGYWIPKVLGRDFGEALLANITGNPYNPNVNMKLKIKNF